MNDKNELLPCPFCGNADVGDEHVQTYSLDSSYDTFGCRTCGAVFVDGGHQEWNRRAPKPEAQAAGVGALSGLRRYYFDGDGVDNTAEFVRLDEVNAALSTPASPAGE